MPIEFSISLLRTETLVREKKTHEFTNLSYVIVIEVIMVNSPKLLQVPIKHLYLQQFDKYKHDYNCRGIGETTHIKKDRCPQCKCKISKGAHVDKSLELNFLQKFYNVKQYCFKETNCL
jgi:hypothetical protein